jgi:hypothetical protein
VAAPSKTQVVATGEGTALALPRRLAAELKPGTALGVASFGVEGALFLKEAEAAESFFCGSLSSLSIPDVFGQILSMTRSGRLIVVDETARRTVSFSAGQIFFATSSEPSERLGNILVRSGMLTQKQVDEALGAVRNGVKLGQVLNRKKLISTSQLYAAMTSMVREIVLTCFEQEAGTFLFLEGELPEEDQLKLPERTRDLVLAGMKRAEQTARLKRRFPMTLQVRATQTSNIPAELSEVLAEGGKSLLTLRNAFSGTGHEFLLWVEEAFANQSLVEESKSEIEPSRKLSVGPATALDVYAALIQTVTQALRDAQVDLSALQSFFADPLPGMEQAFKGVTLKTNGSIDLGRVWKNCDAEKNPLGKVKAYEAMDGFVSYALFSAKNQIPAELAEKLGRDFRKLHQGHDE